MCVHVWPPCVHLCLSVGLWICHNCCFFHSKSWQEPQTCISGSQLLVHFSQCDCQGFFHMRGGINKYKTVYISAGNMSDGTVSCCVNDQLDTPRCGRCLEPLTLRNSAWSFPALVPLSGVLACYHNWIFKATWCHKSLINTLSRHFYWLFGCKSPKNDWRMAVLSGQPRLRRQYSERHKRAR